MLSADPAAVRGIDGIVRARRARRHHRAHGAVARSADAVLPRQARRGPALFIADRMDTLRSALAAEGLAGQFHPSYTRMVPAHHVVEIAAGRLPRSRSRPTRASSRRSAAALPADLDVIGRALHRRAGATKWRAGCSTSTGCRTAPRRSASASPAASTAARSSSWSTTRCAASACRRRGSRRSCSTPAAPTSRRRTSSSTALGLGLFFEAIDAGADDARPAGDAARPRRLQAARRRMRDARPAPVPRHPRALPGLALHASTAMAATRT